MIIYHTIRNRMPYATDPFSAMKTAADISSILQLFVEAVISNWILKTYDGIVLSSDGVLLWERSLKELDDLFKSLALSPNLPLLNEFSRTNSSYSCLNCNEICDDISDLSPSSTSNFSGRRVSRASSYDLVHLSIVKLQPMSCSCVCT